MTIDYDRQYLYDFCSNNNKCAISNIPIVWKPNKINTGSIDRIDSSKPYSKDNIQVVCKYVNYLKSDSTDEQTKQILGYNNF